MAATHEASSSAFHNIVSATSNATSHLSAIPVDLANFLANAASFAFIRVPERIDSLLHGGGSVIAEATGNGSGRFISAALSGPPSTAQASSSAARAASMVNDGSLEAQGLGSFAAHQIKTISGFFTYVTSKWAFATVLLALILNRTQIYASMRRHLHLRWPIRLALRLAPILLFLSHSVSLLQAIRCQTSPRYSYMKFGKMEGASELEFASEGGFLYWFSSKMLFLESEEDSCLAVDMIPPATGEWNRKGSLSLLWPLFQALWLGQFVETMSMVLQGRSPATETGMSIFEHSLAFAEAEGMMSNSLGVSPFRSASRSDSRLAGFGVKKGTRIPRSLLQQVNTPPENLLIGFISACNNLGSQILGVFDKQAQYRLINTGFWGLCYLAIFLWGFYDLRPESGPDNIIMRFPVVCIVGFTPHLLILLGIMVCVAIYILAFSLCFLSPPEEIVRLSFRERLQWAYRNMQAYTHFSNFHIEMRQDFYTALLQTGFMALTAASEAVFLNERKSINVGRWTWLEQQRLEELDTEHEDLDFNHHSSPMPSGQRQSTHEATEWSSGYAKSKVHTTSSSSHSKNRRGIAIEDGVGAFTRVRRSINVWHLFTGIFWLLLAWLKLLVNKCLDKAGAASRPRWLQGPKKVKLARMAESRAESSGSQILDFWMLSDDGSLIRPTDDDVDVATETERRLTLTDEEQIPPSRERLDTNLYNWFKHGGWWGTRDESGSYTASVADDEDNTSIISSTSVESDLDQSGHTTPTQTRPGYSRSPSPAFSADHALDPAHLASLLDPKSASARQEAKMLAYHLTAQGVTTRSRFAHSQSFANTKVLTSTSYRPPGSSVPTTGPLSPDEEAELLEQLILSRRIKPRAGPSHISSSSPSISAPASAHHADSWGSGAAGMGAGGPQCVVCQSAPRTVLAWPCRCLSLCEDCRVSLAMNNFGTCVCCRQEVVGFSRLFVP